MMFRCLIPLLKLNFRTLICKEKTCASFHTMSRRPFSLSYIRNIGKLKGNSTNFLQVAVIFVQRLHTDEKVGKSHLNNRCCLTHDYNPAFTYASSFYSTTTQSPLEVTRKTSKEFLDKYDTILVDCDGVVWRTNNVTPIPGISETMHRLKAMGKQVLFVTNNSMHGRDMYVNKFKTHGFEAQLSDVFCVAYAAAIYLKNVANIKKTVYVLGSKGMQHELEDAGISFFGIGFDHDEVTDDVEKLLQMEFRDDVEAVLVGFDYHFTYNKIYKAASYLMNPDCLYLATNSLERGPKIAPNRVQPVTGAMVAAVSNAAKREPVVVGKPHLHLFECIQSMYPNIDKSRTVMIGDSLPVDIQFAKNTGIDSALVLTGASNLQRITETGIQPTYFLQSLAVL